MSYSSLRVPIDCVSGADVLTRILSWRRRGTAGYITCVNPHSVMTCRRDHAFHTAIAESDLAVPDGVGITIAARLLHERRLPRVAGPSMMLHVCDAGRPHGLRHFFYGGGAGVADVVAERLSRQFPSLQVAGTMSPPFRPLNPDEEANIVEEINRSRPDIVWVALGTGKQEKWMREHSSRLQATALVGVGAAFDFHAGVTPWAPAWVRHAGLEWAYRLLHEPRRLWRRNLDSPVFLARILGQSMLATKSPLIYFRNAH
ncbi:MAG TPA: WecB/TagA/CpsF family glycosyltransferase [Terracidiphilus sp.]|nr:WecB/TagA/CpsF family glycosyltransferase [Terracidiphilus sp.]